MTLSPAEPTDALYNIGCFGYPELLFAPITFTSLIVRVDLLLYLAIKYADNEANRLFITNF